MRAGVKPDPVIRNGVQKFRVVDLDQENRPPIHNRDGEPIDGGGHKNAGISRMLAGEVNELIERKTGQKVVVAEDETA